MGAKKRPTAPGRVLARLVLIAVLALSLLARSTKASLEPRTGGLGADLGGQIGWIGDFNNDKYADLFVIKPTPDGGSYVDVYLWRYSDPDRAYSLLQTDTKPTMTSPIVGLIGVDVNHDGKLDLITFARDPDANPAGNGFIAQVWLGNLVGFLPDPQTLPGKMRDIPLVFDANNDLHADFLAEDLSDDRQERNVWLWQANNQKTKEVSLSYVLRSAILERHQEFFLKQQVSLANITSLTASDQEDPSQQTHTQVHALESVLTPELMSLVRETLNAVTDEADFASMTDDVALPSAQSTSEALLEATIKRAESFLATKVLMDPRARSTVSMRDNTLSSATVQITYSVPEYRIISIPLPDDVKTAHPRLRVPATSATVDLNGDCKSDLVMVSAPANGSVSPDSWLNEDTESVLEVWLNTGGTSTPEEQTYSFSHAYPLPRGAGQLTFFDFNSDGTMDVAFPVCWPSDTCGTENSIRIIYNIQKPMCSSPLDSGGASCRAQDKLCTADPKFSFGHFDAPNADAFASNAFRAFLNRTRLSSHNIRHGIKAVDEMIEQEVIAIERLEESKLGIARLDELAAAASLGLDSRSLPLDPQNMFSVDKDEHEFGSEAEPLRIVSKMDATKSTPSMTEPANGASVVVPTAYFNAVQRKFAVYKPFGEGHTRALTQPPLTLRAGDVDLDGFPDLLVPVQATDAPNSPPQFEIWRSVPCSISLGCTQEAVARGNIRTYQRTTFLMPAHDPEAIRPIYAAAFVDNDNRGSLDVLLLNTHSNENGKDGALMYKNNLNYDAYFLTVMGTNGVCPAWCSQGREFPKPKPYGSAHPGASFKFTVTALSGRKTPVQVAQLPTSAYLPLSAPYTLVGLGRTNNYVEQFFAGFTLPRNHYNLWVAMIPNSQLVVFPYPAGSPGSWLLELFMLPSTKLLYVGIAYAVSLTIIGVTILILHVRERRQDKAEHERYAPLYPFSY